MHSRFDETVIADTDVILTTKASEQVRILLGLLVASPNFIAANFNMGQSTYFNKHYDVSMQQQFKIGVGNESAVDLASSIQSDTQENHFDKAQVEPGTVPGPEELLLQDDVDEEMFIFPDRNGEESKELDVPQVQEALKTTSELIQGNLDRQESKQHPKGPLIQNGTSADAFPA